VIPSNLLHGSKLRNNCSLLAFLPPGALSVLMLIIFSGVALFLFTGSALGKVSTNVPLDDFAYRDLDKLIAQGLIRSDLSATRPLSRLEMARLVHEARLRWQELSQRERDRVVTIPEILARLESGFREELREVTGSGEMVSTFLKPVERVRIHYRYQDNQHSVFNNEGLNYYDGGNAVADLTMRARIASNLGLFAQPRFIYRENRKNLMDVKGNEVDETDIEFHTYYGKLDVKNIEIQFGADSLWWTPSYHGSLIMSNNAEPFKMVKISNPLPVTLPSFLGHLGLLKANLVFTNLDSNRLDPKPAQERLVTDRNEPYFFGLHLDFKPRPWLELGFNYITIYGHERGGSIGIADHLQMMFFNDATEGEVSGNSQVSLFFLLRRYDFSRVLALAETLSFYGEWGAEDMAVPPDDRAFQLGLLFGDLLKWEGRLQLRLEYTNTTPLRNKPASSVWYTHTNYPATYEGRVFGHHAGSNAEDIFARLTLLANPALELGFQADYERHGTSLETEERLLQGQIDAHYRLRRNFSIFGSLGMEQAKNVNFARGASEDRAFLSVLANYSF